MAAPRGDEGIFDRLLARVDDERLHKLVRITRRPGAPR
jgi:hypothetical protein